MSTELKRVVLILSGVIGVALIINIFVSSSLHWQKRAQFKSSSAQDASEYALLNKTKVFDLGKHYIIDFSGLRKRLELVLAGYPRAKAYVYFHYLNNGSWVGINEREQFVAASLVKVPLAMATLRAVEQGRFSLDQKYTVTVDDLDENFGVLYKTALNKEFTIAQLLEYLLRDSDNTARNALATIFYKAGVENPLADVYQELGWELIPPIVAGSVQAELNYGKITTKVLANMFLALYNATYLNLEHSQLVLNHLANTQFDAMIVRGVDDADIVVSHKVGMAAGDETYSDCGIVYVPDRHYALCLGVAGLSEPIADGLMAAVSRETYRFVIEN